MAKEYSDIHASLFEERNDEKMQLDYLESVAEKVNNINGIGNQSLYYDFPYFKLRMAKLQIPFGIKPPLERHFNLLDVAFFSTK